jgi:signal transduction histidine kinase
MASLLLLVLVVSALQLAVGYFAFRGTLQRELADELSSYAQRVRSALRWGPAGPDLSPKLVPALLSGSGRFRVEKAGRVQVQLGGSFPSGAGWLRASLPLRAGYRLQVARRDLGDLRALSAYLHTSLWSFPLGLLLASSVALALQRRLLVPLERLRRAAIALAAEQFPAPLPEGKGALGGLSASFNLMAARLRQVLERERALTRYSSHELRTPLAALRSYQEAFAAGLIPQEEVLAVWTRNLDRMESTLQALLDFTHLGQEQLSEVDLVAVLGELAAEYRPAERSRLRLDLGPRRVLAPREAFRGALRNLIENALRYGLGEVLIRSWEEAGGIALQVRDHGPGVPEERLLQLGRPLLGSAAGHGLGLAYTRQVVEIAGGRLELANAAGGGLEARLHLKGVDSASSPV